MFNLKIENEKKQTITLTNNESEYQITNITGLEPPKANINTTSVAMLNGEIFKSSKIESRNIVISVKVNGNVESNRQKLYSFFKSGSFCKIYFKNANRDVFIDGYCEDISADLFSNKQELQISILCPQPYLNDVEIILNDISKVKSGFTFPFSISEEGKEFASMKSNQVTQIYYKGEMQSGIIIRIVSNGDNIINPTIYNTDTGELLRVDTELNKSDELIINTNKGNKSITLIRNGVSENVINLMTGNSIWLQLENGYNNYSYGADARDDLLNVTIEYNNKYEGV